MMRRRASQAPCRRDRRRSKRTVRTRKPTASGDNAAGFSRGRSGGRATMVADRKDVHDGNRRHRHLETGTDHGTRRPGAPCRFHRHGAGRGRRGVELRRGAGARAAGAVRQRACGAGPAPVVDRRRPLGPAGRGAVRAVGEGRALHRGSRPRLRPRSRRDARCAGRGVRARGAGVRRRRQGAVDPRREGCGRGARRAGARGRAGGKRLHLPLVLGRVR